MRSKYTSWVTSLGTGGRNEARASSICRLTPESRNGTSLMSFISDRSSTVPFSHVAPEEIAAAGVELPSLEQIQANLPPVEAHGSSCSTGGGCSSHTPSPFKAKVEPLIQIQVSPGSSKVIELPKPVDFQPRKTKVPLRMGEQRLIIGRYR
jgi:hypothetical protein